MIFPELTRFEDTALIVVAVAAKTFNEVGPILTVLLPAVVRKFEPLIVMGVSLEPTVGAIELIVGADGGVKTVNADPLVTVTFETVTLIVPVVAPAGIVASHAIVGSDTRRVRCLWSRARGVGSGYRDASVGTGAGRGSLEAGTHSRESVTDESRTTLQLGENVSLIVV